MSMSNKWRSSLVLIKPIILRWGDIRGNRELKDMKELEGASENIEDSEI